ncbi:hypothetical protein C8J56DRAFT_2944 [Mycena floridula]|nr:hypothetical protein C8J56DRAFT_2944 [Mycena floridula]
MRSYSPRLLSSWSVLLVSWLFPFCESSAVVFSSRTEAIFRLYRSINPKLIFDLKCYLCLRFTHLHAWVVIGSLRHRDFRGRQRWLILGDLRRSDSAGSRQSALTAESQQS